MKLRKTKSKKKVVVEEALDKKQRMLCNNTEDYETRGNEVEYCPVM